MKEVLKITDIVQDIIKEAEQEARAEGKHEQAVQTATKMLSKGFYVQEVAELTGLSETEIERIKRILSTN